MFKKLGEKLTWAVLRRKFVGRDGHGNSYYIRMEKNFNGELVEKRFVKFQGGEYRPERMSPEWVQWLQTTRRETPYGDASATPVGDSDDTKSSDEGLDEWLRRQEQKSSGRKSKKTPVIPIQR